jgi:nucleoid-associated protein YgaU
MMTNEHESVFETPDDDEVSGKIDGLDQAMGTEVDEEEPGRAVDAPRSGETYTVQPGDDLRKLAQRFYGDASRYQRIIDANSSELRDSETIRPGLQLTIPR